MGDKEKGKEEKERDDGSVWCPFKSFPSLSFLVHHLSILTV